MGATPLLEGAETTLLTSKGAVHLKGAMRRNVARGWVGAILHSVIYGSFFIQRGPPTLRVSTRTRQGRGGKKVP